ncbi:hypothetical protein G8759_04240 [Spirosoma aureum]|uniref:Uncharacterized protein n=1 Tax=Spirosoma aureum TaxID=2692134 RepID=A0A6G9AHF2_9BACT|nr:hypothetical protein [Spirosoma aureum]QIP11897.1 hypothetical protein G8759_04240 [Spirosoma aureum]
MNKLIVGLLLLIGLLVAFYFWLKPLTPQQHAEKYSELEIPGEVQVTEFSDQSSIFFGGGIICGELVLGKNQIESLRSQASQKNYVFTDSLGDSKRLVRAVTQRGCCDSTNANISTHSGFYKRFGEDSKGSQYAIIDVTAQRLYFFHAKVSELF